VIKRLRRLDVDAHASIVAAPGDGSDRDLGVVRQRSYDSVRPYRRAGCGFRQRPGRLPEPRQKLARDDARSAAGALHFCHAVGERAELLRQQRGLVAQRDHAVADQNARQRDGVDDVLQAEIAGGRHGCGDRTSGSQDWHGRRRSVRTRCRARGPRREIEARRLDRPLRPA
jgi:hypothetical protein